MAAHPSAWKVDRTPLTGRLIIQSPIRKSNRVTPALPRTADRGTRHTRYAFAAALSDLDRRATEDPLDLQRHLWHRLDGEPSTHLGGGRCRHRPRRHP